MSEGRIKIAPDQVLEGRLNGQMKRKVRGGLVTLCLGMLGMLCMLGMGELRTRAAGGDSVIGTLHEVTEDTAVRAEADEASEETGTLKAGSPVIVESVEGAWSKVLYQGVEGYVPNSALDGYGGEEMKGLEQEMDSNAQDEQRYLQEAELAAEQKRSSLIWGIAIAALVLAILGLGIVTALRRTKAEDEEDLTDEEDLIEEDLADEKDTADGEAIADEGDTADDDSDQVQ